jgi:cytochrome c-type biogenesis protein CcmH/NrfG
MRAPIAFALLVALAACNVGEQTALDPTVARRIAELRSRTLADPADSKALAELGTAYADGNRLFDAADSYQAALDHGARDAKTHAGLADVYLRLGYIARSVDELRGCMTIDRSNPDCLLALAKLFESEGSPSGLKEARRSIQALLAAAPSHPRRAEAEKALERIEARLGAVKDEPDAPSNIPEHAHGGAPADDEGEVEEGALPPGHPAMGGRSGEALSPGHPPAQGEDATKPGADTIPGHDAKGGSEVGELNAFGVALQKAFNAVRTNDAPGAEKAFRAALALRPKDPTALSGLAQSLLAQSKLEEAAKTAEEALATDPRDPQARFTFGFIMLKAGKNLERGIKEWESLARDEPEYAKKMGITEMLAKIKAGAAKRGAPPR